MIICKREKLNDQELKDINNLADICSCHDSLSMKINPEMLKNRTGNEYNDFLYYSGEKLIGFIGLYSFGRDEIEMSGMVHPDFRRKGIFTSLFEEAEKERITRGVGRLLMICESKSEPAIKFALSRGGQYSFSEYYMELENNNHEISLKGYGITLRHGTKTDIENIKKQDSTYFGVPMENIDDTFVLDRLQNTYIAELHGDIIGKINISSENGLSFISGFGVLPEFRGKGYGREILGLALIEGKKLINRKAALEVAVNNKNALNLYKSYGFEEKTGYDYYKIENQVG